jgi:hypothetical protein
MKGQASFVLSAANSVFAGPRCSRAGHSKVVSRTSRHALFARISSPSTAIVVNPGTHRPSPLLKLTGNGFHNTQECWVLM